MRQAHANTHSHTHAQTRMREHTHLHPPGYKRCRHIERSEIMSYPTDRAVSCARWCTSNHNNALLLLLLLRWLHHHWLGLLIWVPCRSRCIASGRVASGRVASTRWWISTWRNKSWWRTSSTWWRITWVLWTVRGIRMVSSRILRGIRWGIGWRCTTCHDWCLNLIDKQKSTDNGTTLV